MGLIKLIKKGMQTMPGQMIAGGVQSAYYDTVLEYFRCENLSDDYLFVPATKVLRNGAVNKGSEGVITNGSVFDVAVNQAAILIENGRVHDFVIGVTNGEVDTTGRYRYDSNLEPSLISGTMADLKNNFKAQMGNVVDRMKFGGQSNNTMRLIYINLKEIKGQKIGVGGITFYDNRYNLSLELRGFGTFTYKIIDPVAFYQNMTYDPTRPLRTADVLEELRGNISTVLDPTVGAIENLCQRGYVDIKNHSHELAGYANKFLIERGIWANRGIQLVEISLSLQPTDETKAKVEEIEKAQLYSNPGMAAGLQAQGMYKAMSGIGEGAAKGGSGGGDSMGAMMGMMGMSMMGNMQQQQYAQQYAQPTYGQMQQMPGFQNPYARQPQQNYTPPMYTMQQNQPNQGQSQPQPQGQNPYGYNNQQQVQQPTQTPIVEEVVEPTQPTPPVDPVVAPVPVVAPTQEVKGWTCSCGTINQGKFCMECGSKKPADAPLYRCDKCGWTPDDPHHPPKFCPECGDRFDESDAQ